MKKVFAVDAKQNEFIEINLKMLLEYEDILMKKIMLILYMKFMMNIIILYIFPQ